jgi:hypothetical protein
LTTQILSVISQSGILKRVVAVNDSGGTITPNGATTDIMTNTLDGNHTIAAPTGTPVDGQQLVMRLTQDGTGSRVPVWNAIYTFPGGVTPTLSATAGATDVLGFQYNSATSDWECLAMQIADTAAQVLFSGQADAVQTITSGNNWTDVLLGSESIDTHGGHSTASNTDRYVVPISGNYMINYTAFFTSGLSLGVKAVQLSKNGSTLAGSSRWAHYAVADFLTITGEIWVPLVAGDVIRMQANGVQGGTQELFGQSTDGSTLLIKSLFI